MILYILILFILILYKVSSKYKAIKLNKDICIKLSCNTCVLLPTLYSIGIQTHLWYKLFKPQVALCLL